MSRCPAPVYSNGYVIRCVSQSTACSQHRHWQRVGLPLRALWAVKPYWRIRAAAPTEAAPEDGE